MSTVLYLNTWGAEARPALIYLDISHSNASDLRMALLRMTRTRLLKHENLCSRRRRIVRRRPSSGSRTLICWNWRLGLVSAAPAFTPDSQPYEYVVPVWVGSRVVACRLGPSNPLWKPSGSPSQSKKVADELGPISPHNVNIHVLLAGENALTYSSLLTARLLFVSVLTSCDSFWLFLALSSTTVSSAHILGPHL